VSIKERKTVREETWFRVSPFHTEPAPVTIIKRNKNYVWTKTPVGLHEKPLKRRDGPYGVFPTYAQAEEYMRCRAG
jgi:hypothetical protein